MGGNAWGICGTEYIILWDYTSPGTKEGLRQYRADTGAGAVFVAPKAGVTAKVRHNNELCCGARLGCV